VSYNTQWSDSYRHWIRQSLSFIDGFQLRHRTEPKTKRAHRSGYPADQDIDKLWEPFVLSREAARRAAEEILQRNQVPKSKESPQSQEKSK